MLVSDYHGSTIVLNVPVSYYLLQIIMSVLLLFISLTAVDGKEQTGAAVRPVVSFSPNWATIAKNDSVTLTCNVGSTSLQNQRYSWYKDNERIKGEEQNFRIENAEEKNRGNYQCQTGTSERSDPVTLNVTNERVILQAPPSVYEGDQLTLRCYTPNSTAQNVTFYKDNVNISSSPNDTVTLDASVGLTGTYRCKALLPSEIRHYAPYTSADIVITIQELFSRPEIRANNNSLQEGDLLNISCHTVLNPARANTELQFAFYRNGHNVQGFHSSNHYTIQSARPQDSGSYTCHTAAPSVSVTKGSKELTIYIQGGISKYLPYVIGGSLVALLILTVACIYMYRNKAPSLLHCNWQTYRTVSTRDLQDEEYISYATLDFKHLRKDAEASLGPTGLDNQTTHSPSSTGDDDQSEYCNFSTRDLQDEQYISYATLDLQHLRKGQTQ
ncbi:high affinity immunoglobulin gamma Fc receptor I [Xenopus laevis]|uniref:high affinity immunoglobulin gamma Fc receptor I n=1 Tax=Xenopus laevis TaxID=8355 RepID=UPI001BB277D3|nr:high affinity immunoglobulin gamma Fc receptor I [Xenopus laevis]